MFFKNCTRNYFILETLSHVSNAININEQNNDLDLNYQYKENPKLRSSLTQFKVIFESEGKGSYEKNIPSI